MDILDRIELSIMRIYKQHPELIDLEVINALDAIIREYQYKFNNYTPQTIVSRGLAGVVLSLIKEECELRLKKEFLRVGDSDNSQRSLEDIIA